MLFIYVSLWKFKENTKKKTLGFYLHWELVGSKKKSNLYVSLVSLIMAECKWHVLFCDLLFSNWFFLNKGHPYLTFSFSACFDLSEIVKIKKNRRGISLYLFTFYNLTERWGLFVQKGTRHILSFLIYIVVISKKKYNWSLAVFILKTLFIQYEYLM